MNNNVTQLPTNDPHKNDNAFIKAGLYLGHTAWDEVGDPALHALFRKVKDIIISKIDPPSD